MTAAAVPVSDPLRVLVWHVHGSWMTSFVQGRHRYLVPSDPRRRQWALGRCGRPWPESAVEVAPADLADESVDVVVLQRPEEFDLVRDWLGRVPGQEVPVIYVEHNTPREHAATSRHPMADRSDVTLVHVTGFNRLMWDNGRCRAETVPHGVVDPGYRYTGEIERAASIINEPVRRWRITGTDLLGELSRAAPIDVFGIDTGELHKWEHCPATQVHGAGDVGQERLHTDIGRRRVFVHTARWTSLGLSLLEAMYVGMPVVAVGATEAPWAVPPEAGVVSTDLDELSRAIGRYIADPELARRTGQAARAWAVKNFGITEFAQRWDRLLADTVAEFHSGRRR
ncbi:glycosyltransferase [Nocardia nova]|uniref:glycosyltransferase n=1 Tax=Nocardia nova TaxID=37330 RepID=UPI00372216E3